jgi:hypothetical protein
MASSIVASGIEAHDGQHPAPAGGGQVGPASCCSGAVGRW